jgi:excisionase family DNA binding protein
MTGTRPFGTRDNMPERFLSIKEMAERLGTTERFPRRLIEERRIEFQRFGRHIRVAESVLLAYIESCKVIPVSRIRRGRRCA